ncbi:MAG: E3 binding domain-containing protein, partial [Acidobacteria bacterium]|nr:E3 binding domain-containing protein [Acidobacteriota bacterium]
MATEVVMPQMGESIAEGTITRWLVAVGESVERDQPLFEISTDKVDAEIPSPATGVLLEIKHGEGATVPVDQVVAFIGAAGEKVGAAAPDAKAAKPAAGSEATPAASTQGSAAQAPAPQPSAPEPDDNSLEGRLRRFSSPLVRNIAAKEGVDIAAIEGTGVHGRVTKKDILGYLETRGQQAPAAPSRAASAPAPAARPTGDFHVPAYTAGENVEIVPMSRIRQITAAHMVYSKATSAHVSSVFHVDMTRIAKLRDRVKGRFAAANGTKLTF